MVFLTQSSHAEQAYSMGSFNANNAVGDITPLSRQKSIYSLTLEEFQNSLGEPGKSLGSMNMEELLQNIWTAEESQAMVAAMGNVGRPGMGIAKQPSLHRQGSYSIPDSLGRKTVDEVWKSVSEDYGGNHGEVFVPLKPSQLTFGEITLEDFLMKAGVVKEEETSSFMNQSSFSFGGMDGGCGDGFEAGLLPNLSMFSTLGTAHPSAHVESIVHASKEHTYPNVRAQLCGQQLGASEGAAVFHDSINSGCTNMLVGTPVGVRGLSLPVEGGLGACLNAGGNNGPKNGMGVAVLSLQSDSPHSQSSDVTGTSHGNVSFSPVFQPISLCTKKRLAEGSVETAVKRRQRRMIKNRESAARSRERKQAYTVELENELVQLRDENLMLRQKQADVETRLKQVLKCSKIAKEEQRVLKRAQTAAW